MYLAHKTKPDIAFIIGQFSYHDLDFQAKYFYIVKQVLGYLKKNNQIDHYMR